MSGNWIFTGEVHNDKPLIGILTQPLDNVMKNNPKTKGYTSEMVASYVQFIESAGGRVVPLKYDDNLDYNLKKLEKLNGILLMGGGLSGGPYVDFAYEVYKKVKSLND